jgi:hypothetical protein
LCGRLPKALTDLDLTVIEGVLQLFADWGTTAMLPHRDTEGHREGHRETPRPPGEYNWCQVLGPGLCGYMHACDPNVLLIATPHEAKESLSARDSIGLKLVTTRAIAKGDILTCQYGGYTGLPAHAFAQGCGDAIGEELADEQQAAAELLEMLAATSERQKERERERGRDRDSAHRDQGMTAEEEAYLRAVLCKVIGRLTGGHWLSNACRTVLLGHGTRSYTPACHCTCRLIAC